MTTAVVEFRRTQPSIMCGQGGEECDLKQARKLDMPQHLLDASDGQISAHKMVGKPPASRCSSSRDDGQ